VKSADSTNMSGLRLPMLVITMLLLHFAFFGTRMSADLLQA
jgi:hypothetical protein